MPRTVELAPGLAKRNTTFNFFNLKEEIKTNKIIETAFFLYIYIFYQGRLCFWQPRFALERGYARHKEEDLCAHTGLRDMHG